MPTTTTTVTTTTVSFRSSFLQFVCRILRQLANAPFVCQFFQPILVDLDCVP